MSLLLTAAFQLLAPLSVVGGELGDRLVLRLGHAEPMALVRVVPPEYHAVADAIERGDLFPINPSSGPVELAAYLRTLGPERALRLFRTPAPPLGWRWRQRLSRKT